MVKRLRIKASSFNITLFWKYFSSFLILILLPAIVASTFIYFYVVNLVEHEIEKSNELVIKNFSDQSDAKLSSMRTDLLNVLSTSSLESFLKVVDEPYHDQQRIQMAHSLMRQLQNVRDNELVMSAFLYFPDHDLVIDSTKYTDMNYYLDDTYRVLNTEREALLALFKGRKIMHLAQPFTLHPDRELTENNVSNRYVLPMITSYPFNRDRPDVYLVVNIDQLKLDRNITVNEDWIASTAIIDKTGRRITQSGDMEIGNQELTDVFISRSVEPYFWNTDAIALTYAQSNFNPAWYYVSLVDYEVMMKSAKSIRLLSLGFLAFFLVLGVGISYFLSRRLYIPILEIKKNLELHRKPDRSELHRGNEFDVIKRFSHLLISENNQLFHRVNGMMPIMNEYFLSRILLGEFRDHLSIQYYAEEIGFNYKPKVRRTAICVKMQYYSHVSDKLSETSKSFTIVKVKGEIDKVLEGDVWFCQIHSDLLVCVIHHNSQSSASPLQAAHSIKKVIEQFASYFKATIGVGITVEDMEHLHDSYAHALIMLEQQSLHPEVDICSDDTLSNDRMTWDSFLSADEVGRISNQIKAKEYDKLLISLNELLDEGIRKNVSAYQTKNLCADILNTWIRAVEAERNDFSVSYYSGLFDGLVGTATWGEIKQFFAETHQTLFRVEDPHVREHQFAETLEYIHNHYGEELSIERFADQLGMSAGNFSRVFREVVGEKYVEYIAKLRLSHAKQMLLDTDMKIDEIAEKVGYMGRNSFIRIFKQYEGVTPGKYRSMHQN